MDELDYSTSTRKKIILWLAAFFLLLMLAAIGGVVGWAYSPIPTAQSEIQVIPGDSAEKVGGRLIGSGMPLNRYFFTLLANVTRQNQTVQPGYYALPKAISPRALLYLLTYGPKIHLRLTFPEGWTLGQMRARVNALEGLQHETLAWSDNDLARHINPRLKYAEGWFFPSTYVIDKGSSDLTLYRMAHTAMQKKLALAWQQRDPSSPLTHPDQLLILASIVEKETAHPEDRSLVAAVFVNRLRIGMRLQTDPTVIYGMGAAFDGNLRKADLAHNTPYNSYLHEGLPPTPIALPGAAALLASARPAPSRALYFVAKGDGHSAFSDSLQAHNQAVKKFQLHQ